MCIHVFFWEDTPRLPDDGQSYCLLSIPLPTCPASSLRQQGPSRDLRGGASDSEQAQKVALSTGILLLPSDGGGCVVATLLEGPRHPAALPGSHTLVL